MGDNKVETVVSPTANSAHTKTAKSPAGHRNTKLVIALIAIVIFALFSTGYIIIGRHKTTTSDKKTTTIKDAQVEKLLSDLKNAKDDRQKAVIGLALANRYKAIGGFDQAIKYYESSKSYYVSKGDKNTLLEIENGIQFSQHQVEAQAVQSKMQSYYQRDKDPNKYKDVKPGVTD